MKDITLLQIGENDLEKSFISSYRSDIIPNSGDTIILSSDGSSFEVRRRIFTTETPEKVVLRGIYTKA